MKEKRIYVDADNPGSLESKTKYSRSPASGNWPVVVTVQQTDAQDNILAKTVSYFHGDPEIGQLSSWYDIAPWYNGLEFQTDHFASDGVTLLRRVSNTCANKAFPAQEFPTSAPYGPLDPRLVETTTLFADTNQITKRTFAYDTFNNYIFKWVEPVQSGSSYNFWVSPATLVFENVHDLSINISEPFRAIQIQSIERSDPKLPPNADYINRNIEWRWLIDLEIGEISFFSAGYKQFIRKDPTFTTDQSLALEERGGLSFFRGEI